MTSKVAVASSDGKVVNQHFGRAKQFLVFDTNDNGEYVFKELRSGTPACDGREHHDDLLLAMVDLVSDCQIILVSQIGPGAIQALREKGIEPHITSEFIDEALKKLSL